MKTRALLLAASVAFSGVLQAEDWPQWRGPDGQGHATSASAPTHFSETQNLAWKTPLPGRGHSSPVIMGEQIWLTTALENPASPDEAKRRLAANTGDQPLTVLSSVSLRALCLNKATGEIQHDIQLLNVKDPQWVHQLNSYASPTPVLEAGRLYCHFGAYGSACVDTSTESLLWQNQELSIQHENGPGSTPVLWKDHLIFHCDGSDQQYITALDKNTGKTAWKTQRSGQMRENPQQKKAYGTPLIVPMQDGQPVVVSTAADWLYGYDPQTGKELWKLAYGQLGFSMSPRPVAGHGMVYFSTSFSPPTIMAVKYEGLDKPQLAWSSKKNAPSIPSPLLVGDELYFVNDGGILSCLDAHSGEEVYRERLGGKFTASLTHAAGHIYACSREGVVTVVKAGRKFEIVATNQLDGGLYASPAIVDSKLFIRSDTALYCFK
jgi:outer membrane protein assembly factor BamB